MTDRAASRPLRGGAVILAVWLIAIGLALLVRDAAGWSWAEAWPLVIIVVATGSFASALVGYRRLPAGAWSLVGPLAWIVVGIVLLASTTGALGIGAGELISTWWPAALVGVGLWFLVASVWPGRREVTEALAIPAGGATAGEVRIRFGAGALNVGRGSPGMLVSGSFGGGVVHTLRGPASIDLEPVSARGWGWWDGSLRWDVGLTGEIPLDLRVDTGASRATLDLGDLQIPRLALKTGASTTRVLLPRAAGATTMRAETGAASLTVEVPPGVAARIRSRMALGSTSIDEQRFPRVAGGHESPDYATAPNRVEIEIEGGVGSLRVV